MANAVLVVPPSWAGILAVGQTNGVVKSQVSPACMAHAPCHWLPKQMATLMAMRVLVLSLEATRMPLAAVKYR